MDSVSVPYAKGDKKGSIEPFRGIYGIQIALIMAANFDASG